MLHECIIDGVRHQPFTRARVRKHDVPRLTEHALSLSVKDLARMPSGVQRAYMFSTMANTSIANQALAATPEQIDALWEAEGRILTPERVATHYNESAVTRTSVRVLQLCAYDPGSAVYRYHSAYNTAPGIVSAFVRFGWSNPHTHLRQWDGALHRRSVELLALTADVIHVHCDYRPLFDELKMFPRAHQRIAITYHGSRLPNDPRKHYIDHDADQRNHSIVFGARPYHHRHGAAHWSPIPMPVSDYLALRMVYQPTTARPFRVAHSPTLREIKGTTAFLSACTYVSEHLGVTIEPVLIENMEHGEALRRKASCHAVFDSFWLGMQGSGLEGAAMGMPVIAGDAGAVRDVQRYTEDCPWTFADNETELRAQLHRLATDDAYAQQEAHRVHEYCRTWHDYRVVGERYAATLTAQHGVTRGAANPL